MEWRLRIRYSSESIQRAVAWMALCTKRFWAVNANWNVDNGGWNVNANRVYNPNRWNTGNQVVSRNFSIFSHSYGLEFLFSIPFFHPPSSRPISSIFSRNSLYCLV